MLEQTVIFIQIIFIDIIMAADNAIIIGMIAASFAPKHRNQIIMWGVIGALVFRIIFAFFASYLFSLACFSETSGQIPSEIIFCFPSNQYCNCQYLDPLGWILKYIPSPSVILYCFSLAFDCLMDNSVSRFEGLM